MKNLVIETALTALMQATVEAERREKETKDENLREAMKDYKRVQRASEAFMRTAKPVHMHNTVGQPGTPFRSNRIKPKGKSAVRAAKKARRLAREEGK